MRRSDTGTVRNRELPVDARACNRFDVPGILVMNARTPES